MNKNTLMKKIILFSMAVLAVFALGACGEDTDHEHTWIAGEVTVEPTCTTEGEQEFACECGEEKVEPVEKLAHEYGDYVSDNNYTCTTDGTKTATCEVCGTTKTVTEENSKRHTIPDAVLSRKANCTMDEQYTGYCTVCEKDAQVITVAGTALGHEFKSYKSDGNATCDQDGTKTAVCTRCDVKDSVTEFNSAIGHKIVDNACTNKGCTATPSEGLSFVLSGSEYIVTGMGTCTDSVVIIPSTYEELPVTGISKKAFIECDTIKELYLPDSITKIMDRAFYDCNSLERVFISASVTSIGSEAFVGCQSLVSFKVSDANTAYKSDNAVLYSKNGQILYQYPIGNTAEVYTLLAPVTTISDSAFMGASHLKQVKIDQRVKVIGKWAFADCTSLTTVNINKGVVSIGDFAFNNCKSLANLPFHVSNQLVSIGKNAFEGCSSLVTVTIPKSVTTIGESAFNGCSSVESFNVADGNTRFVAIDGSLYNLTATELIRYASGKADETFTVPASVVTVGKWAFDSSNNLISINFAENSVVETISAYAFKECEKLESIALPASLKTVDACAFELCIKLSKIVIPASVTYVGENAFAFCTLLSEVIFENADGWKVGGISVDVSDSVKNAEALIGDKRLMAWING